MSSAFWLLLYLAPLLGLTAVIFGWLGWSWRGQSLPPRVAQPAGEDSAAPPPPAAEPAPPEPPAVTAHSAASEEELQSLRDELAAAQQQVRVSHDEMSKAQEGARSLESEVTRLRADVARLQGDHAQAVAALQQAREEITRLQSTPAPEAARPSRPAAEKPVRKRVTRAAPASKKTAAEGSLQEKMAELDGMLAKQRSILDALKQERDDWARNVGRQEEQQTPDPAGLGLARRSLADSDERLSTATSEIERLEVQARALQRTATRSQALAAVPDDDLTQIKGIKKVINEQLRAHGIRTWRQIAEWDEEELRGFSELLAFKNRAVREKWREQARALHEAAHGPLN